MNEDRTIITFGKDPVEKVEPAVQRVVAFDPAKPAEPVAATSSFSADFGIPAAEPVTEPVEVPAFAEYLGEAASEPAPPLKAEDIAKTIEPAPVAEPVAEPIKVEPVAATEPPVDVPALESFPEFEGLTEPAAPAEAEDIAKTIEPSEATVAPAAPSEDSFGGNGGNFGSNGGNGGNGGSNLPPRKTPATPKRKKEPKYVTRGVFVVCLIIAIVVSSTMGALMALVVGIGTDSGSKRSKYLTESDQSKSTGSDLTVAEIIDKNENSVVEILVSGTTMGFYGQQEVTEGAGSGVIVKSDGYIVTNYHVISGASKVTVKLHNGDSYSARIVGGVDSQDIAVIKIDAKDLDEVTVADSSTVDVGDLAVAIGNPLGQLGGTATSGIISALDRQLNIEGRTLTLMQTDAAINGGNSGGGLFNGEGNLIGIVDAKSSGVGIEGLGFAIPINSVKETIDDLIESGGKKSSQQTQKASIGISISDISEDNAQYYNLDGAGVYVAQVTGTNAAKAGFQVGDKIVFFDGEAIEDSNSLIEKVRSHKVGDVVTVVVSRNGQQMSIKTELEDSQTASGAME